jgi:hypothetical protein
MEQQRSNIRDVDSAVGDSPIRCSTGPPLPEALGGRPARHGKVRGEKRIGYSAHRLVIPARGVLSAVTFRRTSRMKIMTDRDTVEHRLRAIPTKPFSKSAIARSAFYRRSENRNAIQR